MGLALKETYMQLCCYHALRTNLWATVVAIIGLSIIGLSVVTGVETSKSLLSIYQNEHWIISFIAQTLNATFSNVGPSRSVGITTASKPNL